MKTKILGGIFTLVVMVAVSYGVDKSKSMRNDVNLSDMTLSNVEALASGELADCEYGCFANGMDVGAMIGILVTEKQNRLLITLTLFGKRLSKVF